MLEASGVLTKAWRVAYIKAEKELGCLSLFLFCLSCCSWCCFVIHPNLLCQKVRTYCLIQLIDSVILHLAPSKKQCISTLQNPPLVPTHTWRRTPNHKIIDYYVVLSVATFKRPTLFPRLVHINMMSDVYPGFLSPLWALIVSVRGNFWVYCGMPGSMILNDPQ